MNTSVLYGSALLLSFVVAAVQHTSLHLTLVKINILCAHGLCGSSRPIAGVVFCSLGTIFMLTPHRTVGLAGGRLLFIRLT